MLCVHSITSCVTPVLVVPWQQSLAPTACMLVVAAIALSPCNSALLAAAAPVSTTLGSHASTVSISEIRFNSKPGPWAQCQTGLVRCLEPLLFSQTWHVIYGSVQYLRFLPSCYIWTWSHRFVKTQWQWPIVHAMPCLIWMHCCFKTLTSLPMFR